MALYHGKDLRLYIGGYDVSPLTAACGLSIEVDQAEYAVADGISGYHSLPGIPKSDLSLDAIFDDNYMGIFNTLWGLQEVNNVPGGLPVMVLFGSTVGNRAYGAAYCELQSYPWKSVVKDVNRFTGKLHIDSLPWDESSLAYPKTLTAADGTGTVIDNTTTSANGLTAYLQVFACGGSDALVVKVQTATDAIFTTPVDKLTFTTANGITSERKTTSGTIQRYLRVSWSASSYTSTSFAVIIKR
jgi:hypothetical protein